MELLNKGKRAIAIALSLSFSAAILTGCTQPTQEVVSKQKTTEISFSWWGNDPRHLYTMEAVEAFENENPAINVKNKYGIWNGYEKRNKVYMNSHTESDVMQINYGWLSTYSKDGNGYYDLNELADVIDLSNYTKEDLAFGMINGKLNAIPIAFNTPTIFYNEKIYQKYGLDLPRTWDDLFDAAKKMKQDQVYPIGMAKKHAFLCLIAYYEQTKDKPFFRADGKLNLSQEDIEYLLKFYKRLIDEKVMSPIEEFDRKLLTSGEIAGSCFWISDIENYCNSMEADGGKAVLGDYIGFSDAKRLSGWYRKPATMYAISKYTEHPKEAAELLEYLVNSPKVALLQQMEKGIPVSKKALNTLVENDILKGNSFEANQKMIQNQNRISLMLPVMEDEEIIDFFKSAMDAYVYEKMSLSQAASEIQIKVKEYQK